MIEVAAPDPLVLGLVTSARRALNVLTYYPHMHGDVARACLRERLADLAELRETTILRDLIQEARHQGVTLP